jgi:hypothetical protein
MRMPISQLRQIIQEELINVFNEERAHQESQRQEHILRQLVREELKGVLEEEAPDPRDVADPTTSAGKKYKEKIHKTIEKKKRKEKIKDKTILKHIHGPDDSKEDKKEVEKLKKAFDKTPAKVKKKKTSTKK